MDAPLHRNWLRKFGLVAMLPGLCALSLLMPVQAQSGARSVKKPVAAAKVVQTGAEAGAKSNSRSAVDRPIKDKWAVVVGISEFADKKINLRYPAKDATDFYNFLVSDGGFKKDHVRLLVNEKATRSNILSTIGDRWLPRLAHPDDLVVVYISSHGSPADLDVGGVNYVVAHDTDTESLYATGLPLQDLMRIIKARVHCDRVVMILDACHSGAASAESKGLVRAANVDASAVVAGTGQLVIASSQPSKVSWEKKNYQNSVFTRRLIDALKQNGGRTPLGAAFQNMKDNVENEVLRDRGQMQTPELKSRWDGSELCLSAPPCAPRAGLDEPILDVPPPSAGGAVGSAAGATAGAKEHISPPKAVLNNGNIYRVFNQPQRPTTFEIDAPAKVIYMMTYHWNDGRGKSPGTVALRHSDGTTYGPWSVTGKPGQGGVPDAYWECEPMVTLNPGRYTVIDSDPGSWAQNDQSGNCGIAKVKVAPLAAGATIKLKAYKREPVVSIFNNGNIAAVFNKPSRPTWLTVKAPLLVSRMMNYHWNDGRGQDPGEVGLVHQDGTVYGPWFTHTASGQGGVPNAYWICEPDTVIKPGIYMVTDSDTSTWSQNPETRGAGISEISGVYQD